MTTPQVFVSQSSEATVEIIGTDPVVVEVSVPSVPSVVEVSVPGPQGPAGGLARRHDWAPPYDYLGTAPLGTAESSSAWRITRLTINPAGAVTATGTAVNVTWTGRAGHTYT